MQAFCRPAGWQLPPLHLYCWRAALALVPLVVGHWIFQLLPEPIASHTGPVGAIFHRICDISDHETSASHALQMQSKRNSVGQEISDEQ